MVRSGNVDVVIVGAGAAGIAAARKLAAAHKRFALIEAADVAGGRCITDTRTFGVPFDRGAHWIYAADINPVAKLAPQTGLDLYPAPPGQRLRIGRRYAREGEMEDYLASMVKASSAIADAARKSDGVSANTLPKDLGEWRPSVEFALGPYNCGKDLTEISSLDLARAGERDNAAFCRQGLGALLAKLSAALPVQVATPVTTIDWGSRNRIDVNTAKGQLRTTYVIVTVSTNVLVAGKIKFSPDLPRRHLDAASRLKLGSFDHIAFELTGNPFQLRADELVLEKSETKRTASIFANVSGSTLCIISVGGSFGRDLSAKGQGAMVDFATTWLTGLYGTDMKPLIKRSQATRWNEEPWVLGASSSAAPGAQSARRILMEPLQNRIFFAGEAAHETAWGTLGGAWESGERAGDAVVRLLGGPSRR
jgi:monoamine oxidase